MNAIPSGKTNNFHRIFVLEIIMSPETSCLRIGSTIRPMTRVAGFEFVQQLQRYTAGLSNSPIGQTSDELRPKYERLKIKIYNKSMASLFTSYIFSFTSTLGILVIQAKTWHFLVLITYRVFSLLEPR
jgi:hypothetical protein